MPFELDGPAVCDARGADPNDGAMHDGSANACLVMVRFHVKLHETAGQQAPVGFDERAGSRDIDDRGAVPRPDPDDADAVLVH